MVSLEKSQQLTMYNRNYGGFDYVWNPLEIANVSA